MPFKIIRNDITKMEVDAIVNSADHTPRIGKGTTGAIYAAAGAEELLNARQKIGDINYGEAQITPAFALPAKIIIHTVAPVWSKINSNDEFGYRKAKEQLALCYKNSLALALENDCKSIAFPLLATGINKFPKLDAFKIAVTAIIDFLFAYEMTVFIVVFDKENFELAEKIFPNVESFIEEHEFETTYNEEYGNDLQALQKYQQARSLFAEYLIKEQQRKGISDNELYNAAGSTYHVFYRILNSPNYSPRKLTAIGYALALKLSLEETRTLLSRAGHNLSEANEFDRIIIDCINKSKYNVQDVNEILYEHGQSLIGSGNPER